MYVTNSVHNMKLQPKYTHLKSMNEIHRVVLLKLFSTTDLSAYYNLLAIQLGISQDISYTLEVKMTFTCKCLNNQILKLYLN